MKTRGVSKIADKINDAVTPEFLALVRKIIQWNRESLEELAKH